MNKILYILTFFFSLSISSQDFQGQAFYKTQTSMDFGSWGDRMSAEQKKAMKERMNDLTGGLNLNLPGFDNSES